MMREKETNPLSILANLPRAEVREEDTEKFSGITIANFSLDVAETDILEFIAEKVSKGINKEDIKFNRDKRKITATITSIMTPSVIKDAIARISFPECKEKFFGKPLYCRPLKNLTPEKQKTSPIQGPPNTEPDTRIIYTPAKNSYVETSPTLVPNRPGVSTPSTSEDKTAGTKPKIPGLSTEDQARAIKKQKKIEKQKSKQNEKNEPTENEIGESNEKKKLSAYDLLMWNNLRHSSPTIGLFEKKDRAKSLESSPFRKRGPDQLGSPNSPPIDRETKKNKNDGKTNNTETDL